MNSQFFVWLGDAIYADYMYFPLLHGISPVDVWEKKYRDMRNQTGYRELRETTPILGTWDDHDYGINNGDASNPVKKQAKTLFLDFIDEAKDSPRRSQEGIYAAYTFGPVGKQVKLILLDVRYFRDPWSYTGDTLGPQQWQWLENELKSPGNVTFIASGIQILPQDRFGVTERLHPKTYEKLVGIVGKIPNVFLLSGDIHISEMMKFTCSSEYPVYEITSSGLTHTAYTQYGVLGIAYFSLMQPATFIIGKRIHTRSFCMVDIDWEGLSIEFAFVDGSGNRLHTEQISLRPSAIESPDPMCAYPPLHRALRHWLGSFLLLLPFLLHLLALLLYLRKHSHSY